MTRSEAAAVLGVAEDVTAGDLRRQFEQLHNDFQVRLANAPTPALKKTYQQKLQEIVAAAGTLHPSFAAAAASADLPVAEPVIDGHDARRGANTPVRTESSGPAPVRSGGGTPPEGLPRSTRMAAIAAVVLAGALVVAGMQWAKAASRVARLEEQGSTLVEATKVLQASAEAQERLIYADRLRVQNLSTASATIIAASFVYRDAAGAMKVVHSGDAGLNYPKWEIRSGGVIQLDSEMGRGRLWDGPVTYYSFIVEYPGVEPFLMSGLWAQDVDRDKAVTLDLD